MGADERRAGCRSGINVFTLLAALGGLIAIVGIIAIVVAIIVIWLT